MYIASRKLLLFILTLSFCAGPLMGQETASGEMVVKGDELFDEGKYDQAVDQYSQVLLSYQLENDYEQYAMVNLKIAEAYNRLGRINDGLDLGAEILGYLRTNNVDDKLLLAEAHNVIGDAYLNLGRNDQALDALLKSRDLFIESGHKDTRELASCYNDLGIVYWNNGNKDLALQFHQNALKIRKELHPEGHVEIADSYNNIGLVESEDDFFSAFIDFNNALEMYKELYGDNHPKVAQTLNNLALLGDRQENYDQALEQLNQVLDIWNSVYPEEHPNKAFTYSSIGRVYYNKEDYEQAKIYQERALKMYHILYGEKHPEISNTLNLLGSITLANGEFKASINYYQQAIFANLFTQDLKGIYEGPELENYYNADILLYSLQRKAKAFETYHYNKTLKMRDLNASLTTLELADQLLTHIRQIRLSEKDKIALSAKASEVYEAGIELCYGMSEVSIKPKLYLEKAFDFVEKSKSAALLSAINDTNAKQFAGIPSGLIAREDSLKEGIAYYEQQLAEFSGTDKESEISARLLQLNSEYNAFIKSLETDYPNYYNLKFNVNYISLEELQQNLDEQTGYLTHFITQENDRIFTFLVTNKGLKVESKTLDDNFSRHVSGLRNAIKYDVKSQLVPSTRSLYTQLFPSKMDTKVNQLIIVPDGILGTIPFEVLLSEDVEGENPAYNTLPYLVKRYNISYDNSATLYAQRKKAIESYEGITEDILLVAPIQFERSRGAGVPISLNNLPDSEVEIKEIKHLFNAVGKDAHLLVNRTATEERFKRQDLKKYKYLHFATHGLVNESKPQLSRIFLKEGPTGEEDGSLFSGEIYNIDINAELVCLSACETGLGKVSKGEGIIGLSRALLYAGAENLIVSLWTVADKSTSELMINFYNNHLHTTTYKTFSGALRKAKMSLIQDEEFARPYFWAPFVLIGE